MTRPLARGEEEDVAILERDVTRSLFQPLNEAGPSSTLVDGEAWAPLQSMWQSLANNLNEFTALMQQMDALQGMPDGGDTEGDRCLTFLDLPETDDLGQLGVYIHREALQQQHPLSMQQRQFAAKQQRRTSSPAIQPLIRPRKNSRQLSSPPPIEATGAAQTGAALETIAETVTASSSALTSMQSSTSDLRASQPSSRPVTRSSPSKQLESKIDFVAEEPMRRPVSHLSKPSSETIRQRTPPMGVADGFAIETPPGSASHAPIVTRQVMSPVPPLVESAAASRPSSGGQETMVEESQRKSGAQPVTTASSTALATPPRNEVDDRNWRRMVNLMVDEFEQHKHGPVFKSSLRDLPDYTNFILHPMCLDELRRSVRDRSIRSLSQFQRDLYIMLQNAVMFNGEDSMVYQYALEMWESVDKILRNFAQNENLAQRRQSIDPSAMP